MDPWGIYTAAGLWGGILVYPLLQVVALWRLRDLLRRVAFIPAVLMVPVLGHAAYAYAQNSNLWPIFIIFLSPLANAFLLVLLLASGRKKKNDAAANTRT